MQIIEFHFVLITFTEPITEIHGGPDLFINKGSTINLTCVVKFAPEPPPAMVWSHNQEVSAKFYRHAFNSMPYAIHSAWLILGAPTRCPTRVASFSKSVAATVSAGRVTISSAVLNVTIENHLSTSFWTAHFLCFRFVLTLPNLTATVSQCRNCPKTKPNICRIDSSIIHRDSFIDVWCVFVFFFIFCMLLGIFSLDLW